MVRFLTFFCLPHCFFLLGSPGLLQRIKKNCQIEKKTIFVFISQRTVVQQGELSCGFEVSKQTAASSLDYGLLTQIQTRWFHKYVNRESLFPPPRSS